MGGVPPQVIMPVTSSFFICTTPRSGSSLLSEALEFTGIAGTPREYFEPEYEQDWFARLGIAVDAEYFEKFRAAGMTPNGVFGAKLTWQQFAHLRAKLRQNQLGGTSDLELLARTFPDLRYIFLKRRDKVAQAVSYYKARRTDIWHVVTPDAHLTREAPAEPLSFDFEQIDRWVTRFTEDESRWCRHFELLSLEPFELIYEDFVEAYESTVLEILRHLKIPIPEGFQIAPPRLRKLADTVSAEWIGRYHELKRPARVVRRSAIRCYFISTTPRTGGYLLAEGLQSTRIAGRPREYFEPLFQRQCVQSQAIQSETAYFDHVLAAGTTPNGVFGAKVLWHQFVHLMDQLRLVHGDGLCKFDLLRRMFPDLRYVFLTRRDKIRQAISYDRAIRSGVWWWIRTDGDENQQPQSPAPPTPPFDFEQLDDWVTRLSEFEASWREYFKRLGVKPLEVAYEDFVETYEPTILSILRYLDLPIADGLKVAPPRLRKQADLISDQWVRRYQELKGFRPLPAAPAEPNNGNSCFFTYSHISDSKRGPG